MNVQNWLTNFKEQLNYLGDRTITSIKKGLDVASEFMRDADRGADPADVQTAAVKWQLSQDTGDEALQRSAHLDLEKALSPGSSAKPSGLSLTDFINAKEQEDYRRGRYTTTGNAAKTPRADIMQLQRELNAKGFTDKFGQTLKTDGILGSKTKFAMDQAKQVIPQVKTADTLKQPAPQLQKLGTAKSSAGEAVNYQQTTSIPSQFNEDGSWKEADGTVAFELLPATAYARLWDPKVAKITAKLLQERKQGEQFIKDWEGCSLTLYYIEGRPTIGYGHDMAGESNIPNQITQEQADKWFEEDVAIARNSLTSFLKKYDIALSQQQFNALVSFTFHHGENCWGDPSQYENPYDKRCPLATAMCNFLLKKDFSEAAVREAFGNYIDGIPPQSAESIRNWDTMNMFLYGDYQRS